jgi:general secretion pathway protein G
MWIKNKNKKKKNKGFTMIELIAVIIILGLLAGTVSITIVRQTEKAKKEATKIQISSLGTAITTFHLECGFYPQALDNLINPPSGGRTCKGYPNNGFLEKKEIPKDPWGGDYNYLSPGTHNSDGYDLWSLGPDQEDGTEDDITNWVK